MNFIICQFHGTTNLTKSGTGIVTDFIFGENAASDFGSKRRKWFD